jgi:hypothetical protein
MFSALTSVVTIARQSMRLCCGIILLSLVAYSSVAQSAETPADFFELKIRPVLAKSCFGCHSNRKAEGGLRVDSRGHLVIGGDRGPVIVPGKPESSRLIAAIERTDDDLRMPPNVPLPDAVVADFKRWIRDGAIWPESKPTSTNEPHWAFEPLRKTDPPPIVENWSAHPIDSFIARSWKQHGLTTVAQAEPRVLMRRVYYDLIGLPPTPQQIRDFETATPTDPDMAFNQLVDRLLDSPRYGERWGRHWMDVVRYADTAGDNADYPIPEAYLYRDYIIDAFNSDMPYDQFLREQIAGDLIAQRQPDTRYADRIAATGFLALGRRFGTGPYELWHLTMEDVIDTVGRSTMGLTLKCARCHDHKFDPISTEDYYGLYGIFDSTQFPWAGSEEFVSKKLPRQHFVSLIADKQAAPRLAAFQNQLKTLADQISTFEKKVAGSAADTHPDLRKELAALREEHFQLQRSSLPPDVPGAYAVRDRKARDVTVQISGDPANVGTVVHRTGLSFAGGQSLQIPDDQSGRLQLAQWMTRPDHPLTARVIVNRIWQQHFGRGIVETPSNFGTSGSAPSHPQLLDHLAWKFVESGWSIKTMHRYILTSKTWQLSSVSDARNAEIDTGNRFYWRQNRRRLEAEAIRDGVLLVSGRLHLDRPGRQPFPAMKDWGWTQHSQFKDRYVSNHRSVYLMTQRLQRHPFLALFDGPDTNTTTGRRTISTVAPQALYLMNSPEMERSADALAERLTKATDSTEDRMQLAYRLCYARRATNVEVQRGMSFIEEYSRRSAVASLPEPERAAWTGYCRILLASGEFFYVD